MTREEKIKQMETDLIQLGKDQLELEGRRNLYGKGAFARLMREKREAIERKKTDLDQLKHGQQEGLFS